MKNTKKQNAVSVIPMGTVPSEGQADQPARLSSVEDQSLDEADAARHPPAPNHESPSCDIPFPLDVEAMLARDIWDIRRLPFARSMMGRPYNWARFDRIPEALRPLVKRFCRSQVRAWSPLNLYETTRTLGCGLPFLLGRWPEATDMSLVRRSDLEALVAHTLATPNSKGAPASYDHLRSVVTSVRRLVDYTRSADGEMPPSESTEHLFTNLYTIPSQRGTRKYPMDIPEDIKRQVMDRLDIMLDSVLTPVALVAATGWHGSQVLNMRIDSCIQRGEHGWLVCSAGLNTLEMCTAPVSDELACLVETHRRQMLIDHGTDFNPERYMFGLYDGRGRITSRNTSHIDASLRYFVRDNNIQNGGGALVTLTCRMFRAAGMAEEFRMALARRGLTSPDSLPEFNDPTRRGGDRRNGFDLERMFESDQWDVRRIDFMRKQVTSSFYHLRFKSVPEPFRPLVKRLVRGRLNTWSIGNCYKIIQALGHFLTFYHARRPEEQELDRLTRTDVEAYLSHVRCLPTYHGSSSHDRRLQDWKTSLKHLLQYVIRNKASPTSLSVEQLLWAEDAPRNQWRDNSNKLKRIPSYVLEQVDTKMDKLPPWLFPIVFLLRNSGWRLSDVLNLRVATCLEKTESGWWLRGDIPKTKVKNHRIPISDEVVAVVTNQQKFVTEKFGEDYNPNGFLFPARDSRRYGWPQAAFPISSTLRKFAVDNDIRDETGAHFRLTTHQFRHTLATQMVNNRVPLSVIQKWLAHRSMEMTIHYADVSGETMQRETQKIISQGIVRIQPDGTPKMTDFTDSGDLDMIEWEYIRHNLDAIRLPNGFCFRSKKDPCPIQNIQCHSCSCFGTTPDFLPQFQAHQKDLLILIEHGEKFNHSTWVERNRELLAPVEKIIETLENGKIHHTAGAEHSAGKAIREYTPKERKQREKEREEKENGGG